MNICSHRVKKISHQFEKNRSVMIDDIYVSKFMSFLFFFLSDALF